jgi:hypothetical protein
MWKREEEDRRVRGGKRDGVNGRRRRVMEEVGMKRMEDGEEGGGGYDRRKR